MFNLGDRVREIKTGRVGRVVATYKPYGLVDVEFDDYPLNQYRFFIADLQPEPSGPVAQLPTSPQPQQTINVTSLTKAIKEIYTDEYLSSRWTSCECGAEKIGCGGHSHWCPKSEAA